ncbi:MAG: ABC transporter ATP-binding protein [Oscillospiraceae bacterium]|nr:ABC transporter ATP-binding protein [Oscillospiraceae bacterium]
MTRSNEQTETLAFSMRGISKTFGSVCANEMIDFDVRQGEIHALLGENGSGKSTLMNILSGIYRADCGTIEVFGKQRVFHFPGDAIRCGIGMVYQHFKLADSLTATENIMAGLSEVQVRRAIKSGNDVNEHDVISSLTDRDVSSIRHRRDRNNRMSDLIRGYSERFHIDFDPDKPASQLSVSEKQSVEIIKVLIRGARILVLDEPTAVLTPQETKRLFGVLRKMRDDGCSIVFISHKLGEIMELCDRVTVLRKGRSVDTLVVSEVDTYDLVEKMVGFKIDLQIERPEPDPERLECLRVEGLSYRDEKGVTKLSDLSFSTCYGEILGVAGLAGGGQKELCEVIAGIIRPTSGDILVDGEIITGLSPRKISAKGVSMCFVPEDRLGMGLVASMGMVENILLKEYSFQKGIFVHSEKAREKSSQIIEELDIVTPSVTHPVRLLSGGNIQKVILGREIHLKPKLMIAAYAVRGLDIQSSHTIYRLLNEQKEKKVSVLYIGEDLDVLLALCDRVMVLCQGVNMGIVDTKNTNKIEVGQMMSGTKLEVLKRGVDYVSNN